MFQYFPENYAWSLSVACSIAMGGEISELDEALRPLQALQSANTDDASEQWYQNWTKLGHKLQDLARKDEEAGMHFTASEKYLRSANYFLFAERIIRWSDSRRLHVYGLALEAFDKGIKSSGDNATKIEVDFEGGSLSGWLRVPDTEGPHPAVIFYNGFDSIKEMHYLIYAEMAAKRGLATLFVDQEGTGEAVRFQHHPKRYDTEKSAGKFYDFLTAQDCIDENKIGIVGLSMGGYCAPRAASQDSRFKCVASLGAFYELDEKWESILRGGSGDGQSDGLPESGVHAMHVTGTSDIDAAIEVLKSRNLKDVIQDIQCPLLVVHGENDRQVALDHAVNTVKGALNSPEAILRVFSLYEGSSEHCGVDVMRSQGHFVFDWVAGILGGRV